MNYFSQANERLQALKSDTSMIKTFNVFQEAYKLIELGFIYAQVKQLNIDRLINLTYEIWPKYILKPASHPNIEKIYARRIFDIYWL